MRWQSVRWRHLFLMLFIYVTEKGTAARGNRLSVYRPSDFPSQPEICRGTDAQRLSGRNTESRIERSKTGDILVRDREALLFVHADVAAYIQDTLCRVRHTSVSLSEITDAEFDCQPDYEEIRGTVASIRLDALLALAFSSSRTRLTGLIEGAKVFVNGKLITSQRISAGGR